MHGCVVFSVSSSGTSERGFGCQVCIQENLLALFRVPNVCKHDLSAGSGRPYATYPGLNNTCTPNFTSLIYHGGCASDDAPFQSVSWVPPLVPANIDV